MEFVVGGGERGFEVVDAIGPQRELFEILLFNILHHVHEVLGDEILQKEELFFQQHPVLLNVFIQAHYLCVEFLFEVFLVEFEVGDLLSVKVDFLIDLRDHLLHLFAVLIDLIHLILLLFQDLLGLGEVFMVSAVLFEVVQFLLCQMQVFGVVMLGYDAILHL